MRKTITALAAAFIVSVCCTPAFAHGAKKVRRELTEKGYTKLDFQRTRPPFKLDACLDGERYHLHIDYYGKMTEKTHIGSCESKEAASDSEVHKNQDVDKTAKRTKETGKTTATASQPKTDDCRVTDQAAARAMIRWGVDLRSICSE